METPTPRVLLVEGSDFENFPIGGHLSMARSMMKVFGNGLALVGMGQPGTPIGRWLLRDIHGVSYMFFPACALSTSAKKPIIPARLKFYSALRYHREAIQSLGCRDAFTQSAEAFLAISKWGWNRLSLRFAGIENPLAISRYWYAKPLRRLLDRCMLSSISDETTIFVTAEESIFETLQSRSNGRLTRERMMQLPTCVDTSEFHPKPILEARSQLGIGPKPTVFVNHGRIGRFKGWDLLLDAFQEYLTTHADALLFFVGDGEDRPAVQSRIDALGLHPCVKITGFKKPDQICAYLNAADVALFGSFVEGWSTAMLEALACGKPIVSTKVSGASAMILPGENGFILNSRDARLFSAAMEQAIQLPHAHSTSISIASEFDLQHLGQRMADLWPPLRGLAPAGMNTQHTFDKRVSN